MNFLGSFLANKLAAPLALAGCLILAVIACVQTVRIDGISFFGWQIIEGWKPRYKALISQNEQDEIARLNAAVILAQKQDKALAESNRQYLALASDLGGRIAALQNRIDVYVPQEVAVACVPTGLALVLNYAISGTPPEQIPAPSDKLDRACSGVSVRDATRSLVFDLGQLPILKARIENARAAWQAEYELTNPAPCKKDDPAC